MINGPPAHGRDGEPTGYKPGDEPDGHLPNDGRRPFVFTPDYDSRTAEIYR